MSVLDNSIYVSARKKIHMNIVFFSSNYSIIYSFFANYTVVTEMLHDESFTLQILKIQIVIGVTNRVLIFFQRIILIARDQDYEILLVAVSAIIVSHLQSLLKGAIPAD